MDRAQGADQVAGVLQSYADRGVFRGLKCERASGGRHMFTFTWLMRRPMTLGADPSSSVLTFKELLPCVDSKSMMVAELKALVEGRRSRALPEHKRIDGRRAHVTCAVWRGAFSLTITGRGRHYEYALRKALNLVNELFVLLHEKYPDYLIEHFGLATE